MFWLHNCWKNFSTGTVSCIIPDVKMSVWGDVIWLILWPCYTTLGDLKVQSGSVSTHSPHRCNISSYGSQLVGKEMNQYEDVASCTVHTTVASGLKQMLSGLDVLSKIQKETYYDSLNARTICSRWHMLKLYRGH